MKCQEEIEQLLKEKYGCLKVVEAVFPPQYKHLNRIYFNNLILCNKEYNGNNCLRVKGTFIIEE